MLIDSHSHLNLKDEFPDLEKVHSDMNLAGVEAAIVVGIDLETSQNALELNQNWIFPSAGIHPQSDQFDDEDPKSWKLLENQLDHPRCIAVGETGLDFYHNRVDAKVQKMRFVRHLELAREKNMPIIVHCREADKDVMDILEKHGEGTQGVLHCWAGGESLANLAIEMGWYISLAGNLTFKNAGGLREATYRIKSNRFLVESDCPYLTPHPFRGKQNNPSLISYTAKKLAEILKKPTEEIVQMTRQNTIDLFNLPLDRKLIK